MLNEETLAQKFVKKGFWLYFFTFIGAPLAYIIKMILARDLSLNDYGLFYSIISFLTLLSALNDLGGTENLNYFLPKYVLEKKFWKVKYLLQFVFKIQIGMSLFMMFMVFFLSDFLANYHFKDAEAGTILKIFSLFFLSTNLINICVSLFSALQNTKLQKFIDFFRSFASLVFVLVIFLLDFGSLLAYSWAWIGGVIAGVLVAWYYFYFSFYQKYLQNIPTERDENLKKNFIKYAIPVFLTANISLILSQIDSQLITNMLGNSANAMYSNYLSIFSIPFLFLAPFLKFLFPVFTELFLRKNLEKIRFLYSTTSLILIILAIWISVFFFQNGTTIAVLLFWEPYRESGIILQFSVPFLIFNLLNTLNFQLLAWSGHIRIRMITFLLALPINIILNIIFIDKFGVSGSALAVGMSWIPMYCITMYYTKSFFSLPKILPIFINIFMALASYFLIFFLWKLFSENNYWQILLCATLGYAMIFLATNFSTFKNAFTIIKNNRS